jgi:hypothetical protein
MELNSSELEERLNTDLENIHKWLIANKLTLNKQKTEYMIVGSGQRLCNIIFDPKIELGGSTIKHACHQNKNISRYYIDEKRTCKTK